MSATGELHDHLVLIVHGVGDPKPGETVELFARSMAERDTPLESHGTIHWIEEHWGAGRNKNCFPVHTHRLRRGRQSAYLSEVFWGDISRIRDGRFGLFRGLFDVLFGMRFVAHQAASQQGWAAGMLRWTGNRCADLLEAPLAAVNLVMAILLFVGIVLLRFRPSLYGNWQQANWIILAVALATMVVAIYRGSQAIGPRRRGFYRWVGFWGFDLALLSAYQARWPHDATRASVFIWHAEIVIHVLEMLSVLLTLMVATLFVWWALARWRRGDWSRGIDAGLLLPMLTVGLWGLLFPTLWLLCYQATHRFVGKQVELARFSELMRLFDMAVPLFRIQWLMALGMLVVTGVVVGRFIWWSVRNDVSSYRKARPAPRLIVHRTMQTAAVFASLLGIATVLYLATYRFLHPELRWKETPIGAWLQWGNEFAVGGTVLFGFAVLYLPPYIRIGVDIIFDVVTHFYQTIDEESEVAHFRYRDAIQARFNATLGLLARHARNRADLTIVAHSQGTIIAIEALRDCHNSAMFNRFHSVTFVTMGSPFRHIYQHYFRHLYPSLDDSHWSYLRDRVQRWINVFRIDDFVGTYIVDETASTMQIGTMTVTDIPVEPKGHTLYWNDRHVLAELRCHGVVWGQDEDLFTASFHSAVA